MAEYQRVQDAIEASNAWELDRQLEIAMDALRLPPPDADVTKISGGEKRRVALCKILLEKPDLLLLDEPTNHLDAESVAWLERHLAEYPGTVVAVTHDRYFLDNVAGWILELDRGAGIPWKGNYSSWLEQKEQRLELEEKAESAKRRTLQRELEWIKMSPRARHAKSKARIERYEALLADTGPRDARRDAGALHPAGAAPGRRRRARRGRAQGLRRPPADGRPHLRPAARRHRRHHRPQRRRQDDALQDDRRPGEAGRRQARRRRHGRRPPTSTRTATGRTRARPSSTRSPAARTRSSSASARSPRAPTSSMFNFKGPDQQKRIGDLSGGEMNRLHLARTLKKGGNVLLLDEPTNDLDVDTLRALEEALLELRRLRGRHQPRPLVPRPHRHAHPRLRGRQPDGLVRGQLPGVRGRPEAPPRHRSRPAAPDQVQAAGRRVEPLSLTSAPELRMARDADIDGLEPRLLGGRDGIGVERPPTSLPTSAAHDADDGEDRRARGRGGSGGGAGARGPSSPRRATEPFSVSASSRSAPCLRASS